MVILGDDPALGPRVFSPQDHAFRGWAEAGVGHTSRFL